MRYNIHHKNTLEAYAKWFKTHYLAGSDLYLLTFMFNPLPSGQSARLNIINKDITRTYAKQLTRHVRNPKSSQYYHYPIWIGCPDWPVYKRERQSKLDITINDGLHAHVLASIPQTTRMKECFADHINSNQRLYVNDKNHIQTLDAVPITETIDDVPDYIFKSITRDRASLDDIILLPRSSAEMWD